RGRGPQGRGARRYPSCRPDCVGVAGTGDRAMTGVGRCADVRLVLGVYVLGAAEPAERTLVRMHLAWCRDCLEELAGLAGLPGLLRRGPAAEAAKLFCRAGGAGGRAPPPPARAPAPPPRPAARPRPGHPR